MRVITKSVFGAAAGGAALAWGAAEAAVPSVPVDTQFVLNSFLFLFGGVLVMFMAAGFCMLEAGLVRTKNVADICLKNVALYSLAGVMYYLVGYEIMYGGGAFASLPGIWDASQVTAVAEPDGYAKHADWFFQMVFVATAASIVSGAVAERVKLFPFLVFVLVLTAVIYPVQGAWKWGGGWLSDLSGLGLTYVNADGETVGRAFNDFAGSTIVHSVGGWAALMGAIILGPRLGKYAASGRVSPMPGSNLPLATLGTFILWFGWFGFNGASQLAMGTVDHAIALSRIFANTNMAAAGGVLAATILTKALYKKVDLTLVLNGALAGLVSITAEPLTPSIGQAILIGAVGSMIVTFAIPMLDRLKIDDVVGAIPVHLVAGVFGTLVVPLTNPDASVLAQLVGIVATAAWVIPTSALVWFALKLTVGIRMSEEDELIGGDAAELGLEAYPEFVDGVPDGGRGQVGASPALSPAHRTATA